MLKTQTETSGLNHLKSSNQFFSELSKMTEIAETCREKRRIREETMRYISLCYKGINSRILLLQLLFEFYMDIHNKILCFRSHQHNLKLQWKRLMESKRIYETRCREEVASNQFYHQEISRLGKSSREAEKVC